MKKKTTDLSEFNGIIQALRPASTLCGKDFSRFGAALSYADYMALERALMRNDIPAMAGYLSTVTGVPARKIRRLDLFRFAAALKQLAGLVAKTEERFYQSSKPAPMTGFEQGCGFEELNEKFRHEQRLVAAAKQRLATVDEMLRKPLAEVLNWYAFAKAEQDAVNRYSEKIQKLKNHGVKK